MLIERMHRSRHAAACVVRNGPNKQVSSRASRRAFIRTGYHLSSRPVVELSPTTHVHDGGGGEQLIDRPMHGTGMAAHVCYYIQLYLHASGNLTFKMVLK